MLLASTSRISQSGVLYAEWVPIQVVWIQVAFTKEVNESGRGES